MRSLQLKVSLLVVSLLVLACVSLALIATHHERGALEAELEKRGRALAASLAGAAKESLLDVDQGDFEGELLLERLVEEAGGGEGVMAARLLGREGRILASVDPDERGGQGLRRSETSVAVVRDGSQLLVAAPIRYADVLVGESQVVLDLRVLVDPVVTSNRRQLTAAAVAVVSLGVVAGVVFVMLLVGPLRRLRLGVERLSAGDLGVRVPPTSRDEVGELTRAFNRMGDSLEQKQRVQNAFGRYVNDYVLGQLLQGPEEDQSGGIEREVTVLFADIRSFTRTSEGMKAHDVVKLLNDFFQLASDCILERGGTIDKFIGDSVMAYFGAPVPHSDHALRATSAAIDIVNAMQERSRRVPQEVPVHIGIGVHTGVVVVGNIGSDRRTDFTAVGDPVNVAHRLEKLAQPGQILVSEAVRRVVRGVVELRFEGERQLSGREEPVHVYSVSPQRSRERADRQP